MVFSRRTHRAHGRTAVTYSPLRMMHCFRKLFLSGHLITRREKLIATFVQLAVSFCICTAMLVAGCATNYYEYEKQGEAAMKQGAYIEAAQAFRNSANTLTGAAAGRRVALAGEALGKAGRLDDAERSFDEAVRLILGDNDNRLGGKLGRLHDIAITWNKAAAIFLAPQPEKARAYALKVSGLHRSDLPFQSTWVFSLGSEIEKAGKMLDGLGDKREAFAALHKVTDFYVYHESSLTDLANRAEALGLSEYARAMRREASAFAQIDGKGRLFEGGVTPADTRASAARFIERAKLYRSLGATLMADLRQRIGRELYARANQDERDEAQIAEQRRRDAIEDQERTAQDWRNLALALGNIKGGSQPQAQTLRDTETRVNTQSAPTPTSGNCNKGLEACTIDQCRSDGGRPHPHAKDGCRYVTCTYADSTKTYSVQVLRPAGSSCVAGYIK